MRAFQLLIWILLERTAAAGKTLYVQGVQEESVEISCHPDHQTSPPTAFRLYRKSAQTGKNELLLSIPEHVKPKYNGRVRISGQLSSNIINVTLLGLRSKDTGLYVCEFTTAASNSQKMVNHTDVILYVKVKDGECTCYSHSLLIYIISAAVALLLFTLLSISAAQYRKSKICSEPAPAAPVYEQMTGGRPAFRSSNRHRAQAQPQPPAHDLVYAVVQKGQMPECHYAVPRKATPKQELNLEITVEVDQNN